MGTVLSTARESEVDVPFTPQPAYASTVLTPRIESLIKDSVDLASDALLSKVVDQSDEFFAKASQMIQAKETVAYPNEFIATGAKMDGWETRRHNKEEDDWAIIQLGYAGTLRAVDIDTSYFTGNNAPAASVDGAFVPEGTQPGKIKWREVLGHVKLAPDSHNYFELDASVTEMSFTHLRLRIYPDGGVARFRAYGTVRPVFPPPETLIDLASVGYGGRVVDVSNAHYSSPSNLLLPGRGVNMGDGWETKRSRTPGHMDWVVVRLGVPGHVDRACIDTLHFRGNFPETAELYACATTDEMPGVVEWDQILQAEPLKADREHKLTLTHKWKVYTHVRLVIRPDGGVKRLRLWCKRDPSVPVAEAGPRVVSGPSEPAVAGGKGKGKKAGLGKDGEDGEWSGDAVGFPPSPRKPKAKATPKKAKVPSETSSTGGVGLISDLLSNLAVPIAPPLKEVEPEAEASKVKGEKGKGKKKKGGASAHIGSPERAAIRDGEEKAKAPQTAKAPKAPKTAKATKAAKATKNLKATKNPKAPKNPKESKQVTQAQGKSRAMTRASATSATLSEEYGSVGGGAGKKRGRNSK